MTNQYYENGVGVEKREKGKENQEKEERIKSYATTKDVDT